MNRPVLVSAGRAPVDFTHPACSSVKSLVRVTVDMKFAETLDGEIEFACKLDVLFTVYTRLPLTGFMLVYALGSKPKKTPEAKYALEFSTSMDAQLLKTNLLSTGLYST